MTNTDPLRQLARTIFEYNPTKPDPEPAMPTSNTVPGEGNNPVVEPSDEEYMRDFARRMFSDDAAATEPQPAED